MVTLVAPSGILTRTLPLSLFPAKVSGASTSCALFPSIITVVLSSTVVSLTSGVLFF